MNADLVDVYLNQVIRDRYPFRKMMKLLPVISTSISDIGYDIGVQTLYVRFNNGFTYQYGNVPPQVYSTLMNSESIGAYFNRNIRGRYPYRRIWVERLRRLELMPQQIAATTVRANPPRMGRRGAQSR